MIRRVRFENVFLGLVLCACNGSPACPDGGTCSDAAPDVAPMLGASFNISTALVIIDPGDSHPVVVTLDRGTVTGNIDVTVQGLPNGVTQSPLTILPGSSAGTFNLIAAPDVMIPQDVDVTVIATAGSSSVSGLLHIRVGSVFHVSTQSETFVVPQNQSSLVFQVWGAGGGAGGNGGVGGGGGFATAQVDVTPGETLMIAIGGAGGGGDIVPSIAWSGGGGGGYSAVLRGTDVLVIAGGGGGGGGSAFDGGAGFAGGGGGSDGLGSCGGFGGSDAGGGEGGAPNGQPGSSLAGGAGGCDSVCAFVVDGGANGGGSGAIGNDAGTNSGGGGGGGAGFFGGGGGGSQSFGCGGGGGSAFASVTGASVKILAATGQLPAGLSFVGYADSGAAFGGAIGDAGQGTSGTPGLIAIAYPK